MSAKSVGQALGSTDSNAEAESLEMRKKILSKLKVIDALKRNVLQLRKT